MSKYRFTLAEGNRILGWVLDEKEGIEVDLSSINPFEMLDEYGRGKWAIPTYPEGPVVFDPLPYSDEQAEELRKQWCKAEIAKAYPPDEEAKILREKLMGLDDATFTKYNETVQAIIAKSKEMILSSNQ